LPAASIAGERRGRVGEEQSTTASPSIWRSNVEPASLELKLKLGVPVIVVCGGVVPSP
jgi:hypothetical protein